MPKGKARRFLAEARNVRGYTQADVARLSGICVRHYQAVELGERNCTIRTARKIIDVLGIDKILNLENLLGG